MPRRHADEISNGYQSESLAMMRFDFGKDMQVLKMSPVNISRKNVPDRGNSECKCPEEGMSPGFSDGQKEADAGITEQVKAEGGESLGACPVEPIGLPPP